MDPSSFEQDAPPGDDVWTRTGQLLTDARRAARGGDLARAVVLLDRALELAPEPLRPALLHLRAVVCLTGGIVAAPVVHETLVREAMRTEDPALAIAQHADAAVAAVVAGRCVAALAAAERAASTLPADADGAARCHVRAIHGMALALRGRRAEAAVALDEAGRLVTHVDPVSPAAQSVAFALHARIATGQVAQLRDEQRLLVAATRPTATLGLLAYYLLVGADAAFRLGDWDAAEAEAAEAVAVAQEAGVVGPLSIALVISGRGHAVRGRESQARADLAQALDLAAELGYGATRIWATHALGVLELGFGRTAAAIEQLERVAADAGGAGLEDPVMVPWAADLVEAYARAGRRDEAEDRARELAVRAHRSRVPLALALAARAEGLTAGDDFEAPLRRALELHDGDPGPFERARTLLALGFRLHGAGRRAEARAVLDEAEAVFTALGAAPWAAQAAA